MSGTDTTDVINTDLEAGPASPDLQNDVSGAQINLEEPKPVIHTDKDYLARAREVNKHGKFIFTCYSELNTFLLLRTQDEILKLQIKLHDSIKNGPPWTDEDSTALQKKLKQYRILSSASQLIVDEALSMQKSILTWEHPPFKASQSAGEFLFGKEEPTRPLHLSSYAFPSAIAYGPAKSLKDFDGSDYVDLCPQNSTPINHFLRKVLPKHISYNAEDGKIVAYLQSQNTGLRVTFPQSHI